MAKWIRAEQPEQPTEITEASAPVQFGAFTLEGPETVAAVALSGILLLAVLTFVQLRKARDS
jgi:hypothetical protein